MEMGSNQYIIFDHTVQKTDIQTTETTTKSHITFLFGYMHVNVEPGA